MTASSEHPPPGGLVVCLGNSLVGDDAVGALVHQRLSEGGLPENVRLEYLGTAGGLALLEVLQGEPLLVIVDAVQLGAGPGTVHCLQWDELPRTTRADSPMTHDLGVSQALQLSQRLHPERTPQRVVLVGVEGRRFEVGEPSAEVVAALDEVVAVVLSQLGEG